MTHAKFDVLWNVVENINFLKDTIVSNTVSGSLIVLRVLKLWSLSN